MGIATSNLLKNLIPQSLLVAMTFALSAVAMPVQASTFTRTSPTSAKALPTGVSEIGGIVLDLIGANGTRVVSQLSANSLFLGMTTGETPTTDIGVQTGFDASILSTLGGGLKEVAIRFSLFDGDTSTAGMAWNLDTDQEEYMEYDNFDRNDNSLLLNGLNFGNWSTVNAQNTDIEGNADVHGFSGGGFRDGVTDTGWFYTTNSGLLDTFYNSLVQLGQVTYQLYDIDPGDQYLDFKRGIGEDLTNIGQTPRVVPVQENPQPVPEPSFGLSLLALGALGVGSQLKRKREQKA